MTRSGKGAGDRSEFLDELARLNLQRLLWVLAVVLVSRITLLELILAVPEQDRTLVPMLRADVILAVLLIVLTWWMRRTAVASRVIWLLLFFFAANVLRSAIAQALFAVHGAGHTAVYIFGVMIIGTVFVWPPRFLVPMLVIAHVLFGALMLAPDDEWIRRVATYLDSTVWVAFVGVISWLLYRAKRDDFNRRREIKSYAEALEQRNAELDELMAIVAHDLRSPLHAQKCTLEFARNLDGSPGLQRALTDAASNCGHLLAIAGRLVETHALSDRCRNAGARSADLRDECAAAVSRIEPLAAEKRVRVAFEQATGRTAAPVKAEPAAVARVLDNLLTNAVRHSPLAGSVRLALDARDGCWTLDVRDEGPGVPDGEREAIFRKFRRGPHEPDNTGSLGLGLFIVKKLVTAMKGRIQCLAPEDGVGAVFRLELPKTDAPTGPGK